MLETLIAKAYDSTVRVQLNPEAGLPRVLYVNFELREEIFYQVFYNCYSDIWSREASNESKQAKR